MQKPKNLLLEASLDLAWSHWVGLGARGTARPPDTAVDPEALLYFTACIADHDPRLRDEVGDWWRQFGRHVSPARLTALAKRFDESVVAQLRTLQTSFAAASVTSGKSQLDHLETPARSLLRLRCAFGGGSRADILLDLLTRRTENDQGSTVLALSRIGYSKRNVALVVDELVLGGIVSSTKEGNRARYRLVDATALKRVLRPLPEHSGSWHIRLPILATFIDLAKRIHGRDVIVQSIEARKTFASVLSQIKMLEISTMPTAIAETYWATLQQWLIDNLISTQTSSGPKLVGMIEGVWVGPGQQPRRSSSHGSAVLPRSAASRAKGELQCLDLVQVPTIEPANGWAWAVLSTAATNVYSHTIGMNRGERWRFATWDADEMHVYAVEYDEPLAPERIAKLYGNEAAGHARLDQPALRLRLRRVVDPT